jgi:hypothetical protein
LKASEEKLDLILFTILEWNTIFNKLNYNNGVARLQSVLIISRKSMVKLLSRSISLVKTN